MVPQEEHHIEGMCATDIGTEFFNQGKESYKVDKICHILFNLLMKDFKNLLLSSKLNEVWKRAYDEGNFHLLDGILYHRTKHTFVIKFTDRTLINTILHGFHDSVVSGRLSEDRILQRVKTFSWWPNWRKYVAEYYQTKQSHRQNVWVDDPNIRTKIPMGNSSHGLGNSLTSRWR
ncbi:hypothetical protein O181_064430 [Austropuccinia psidii MF-1]|uniref:Integrase zinc-binding domain-containing protein n=1 Tax=Austropuccinia psidii MF-1 TaxID=1389203 RepID=A0A9Q3EKH2_9BASI|nr:hypothetical protein [Austropuccinia psidii MF-1]